MLGSGCHVQQAETTPSTLPGSVNQTAYEVGRFTTMLAGAIAAPVTQPPPVVVDAQLRKGLRTPLELGGLLCDKGWSKWCKGHGP